MTETVQKQQSWSAQELLVAYKQGERKFRDADLTGANLTRAYLSRADLTRANLSRAYLSRAYLSRAYLSRANLSDADLSGANLSGANLSDADLSGAVMRNADLSGADLRDADLSGADLRDADLSGADLRDMRMNWGSHTLIGERLYRAAEDRLDRIMVAGAVHITDNDWCWDRFLDHTPKDLLDWALTTMQTWIVEGDGAPVVLCNWQQEK